MKPTPKFEHDCKKCRFLGPNKKDDHDLYFCWQTELPTVIARYGNYGHEYKSGMAAAHVDQELGEAMKLAAEQIPEIGGMLL